MRGPYVYYAQFRTRLNDPMYAKVDTTRYGLAQQLQGREEDFITFAFSPLGTCKVFELNAHDRRHNTPVPVQAIADGDIT
jgi:hypothetical protein